MLPGPATSHQRRGDDRRPQPACASRRRCSTASRGRADYVLKAQEVEPLLSKAAGASVSRALAARGVDAVLRTDRQAIARDAERHLQELCRPVRGWA